LSPDRGLSPQDRRGSNRLRADFPRKAGSIGQRDLALEQATETVGSHGVTPEHADLPT
jgi:hypothetical protein